MSHAVRLSDETYRVMRELADDRGQSPEELVAALLADAWERECARYDAAFHAGPDWLATADEVATDPTEPVHEGSTYPSTETLFRALGAGENDLEVARRLDREDPGAS